MDFSHLSSKSHFASGSSGFTMVEILVVITISAFLFSLGAPFIQTAHARIQFQNSLKQIALDIQSTLNHAYAGKSIASLSLQHQEILPAYYGIYFEVDRDDRNPKGYKYVEFNVSQASDSSSLHPLHVSKKALPHEHLFLRSIHLRDQDGNKQPIDAVWMLFSSPFGKPYFLGVIPNDEQSLNLDQLNEQSHSYEDVELDFQYKESSTHIATFIFDADKVMSFR